MSTPGGHSTVPPSRPPATSPAPVNSSIADNVDGLLLHLHARDVTLLLVPQAPLEGLQQYKRRVGRRLPGLFRARRLNFDLGFSQTEEQAREAVAQMWTGAGGRAAGSPLPPTVEQNARRQALIRSGTSPKPGV
jgi:hypothetical protein